MTITNSNKKKDELLGMSHGTAYSKLRRDIIYWLAGLNGMLVCFRCGETIERIEDFSIEHKRPWQYEENPKEAFFDIKNIAFSHLVCNISSARKPTKGNITHGLSGYHYQKCRCQICREGRSKMSKIEHQNKKSKKQQ